ncbi:uncharacterized protein LOC131874299 [Cryptomeria japonica]|uniref:uncharacterized protein LOC131874299 n=1 Tax=Cryptomeria japonica TaxID=3369 RepID=UPI0027DA0CAA|nr:uncharacterized protein LOC131874299 [Cryptomeria japonica]
MGLHREGSNFYRDKKLSKEAIERYPKTTKEKKRLVKPSISESEEEGLDSDFFMGDESESDSISESEENLEDSEVELGKKRKQRKDLDIDQKVEEEITGEGFDQRVGENAEQITSGDVPNNEHDNAGEKSPPSIPPIEGLKGFVDSLDWLINSHKKVVEDNKKLSHRVKILETISNGEGKSMAKYVEHLSKTTTRAEEIRDAFNPKFEQIEKPLAEIKTNDNAKDHRIAETDNKFNKIEKCLKSIAKQSHNILKASTDNTKILISKLENKKDSLELEPDTGGMGEVQGPEETEIPTQAEQLTETKKPTEDKGTSIEPPKSEKPTVELLEKQTEVEVHVETKIRVVTETLKQFEKPLKVEVQTQTNPPEENISKMDTSDENKEDIVKVIGQTSIEMKSTVEPSTSIGEFRPTNITQNGPASLDDIKEAKFNIRRKEALLSALCASGVLEESEIVSKVLRSLPLAYKHKIVAIEEIRIVSYVTRDILIGKLAAFELRKFGESLPK